MNPKYLINTQTKYGSKVGIIRWLNEGTGVIWAYCYKLDKVLPLLIDDLNTTEEQKNSIPYEHNYI